MRQADGSALSRFTPPPALVAALVAALLAAGLAAAVTHGGGDPVAGPVPLTTSTLPTTTTASGPSTTAPANTSTTTSTTAVTAPPAPPPTPAQARLFGELERQVASLRGLEWKSALDIAVVSRAELARRLQETVAREERPERTTGDEAALKLLQLIPRTMDYRKFTEDLLAEQVQGFYDPKTKQLVVATAGDGSIGGSTKLALVHEMDHALTDQHFNFGAVSDALDAEDRQEESFSLSALIEGDAVLLQRMWARRYPPSDLDSGGASGSSVLDQAPSFLRNALFFPYTQGLEFVTALHRAGGWAAVNDAYRQPPVSTEQILHPELYRAGEGWSAPPLPDLPAETGCAGVRTGTIGEFQMADVLSHQVERASEATENWDGDAFSVVRCGSDLAMVERWWSEDEASADRFTAAAAGWARGWSGSLSPIDENGRFSGPKGSGRLLRSGRQVDLVLGDTPEAADKVAGAVGTPS